MKRQKSAASRIQNSHFCSQETFDFSGGGSSSTNSQSLHDFRIHQCTILSEVTQDASTSALNSQNCMEGSIDSNAAASARAPGHASRKNNSYVSAQGVHFWCKPWHKEMVDNSILSLGWVVWADSSIDSEAAVSVRSAEYANVGDQSFIASSTSSANSMASPPSQYGPL